MTFKNLPIICFPYDWDKWGIDFQVPKIKLLKIKYVFPLTSSKKSKLFKGYQENVRFSKYILFIAYLSYYLMFQIRKLPVAFSFMICFWAYRNSWTLDARVGRWTLNIYSPASIVQCPEPSVQSPASNSCVQSPAIPVCHVFGSYVKDLKR